MRRLLPFAVSTLLAAALPAATIGFTVDKIASDQPGVARITDSNLVNAWGLISSGSSPWWIGANGSGTSLVYNGATETKNALTVAIQGDGSVTGVAFNGTTDFNGDLFLFGSEDGTVSGWRGALGPTAEVLALASPDNVYKGITVGSVSGNMYAYLANFRSGQVDVVKGNAGAPDLAGKFTDPNLPAGYAPFNVMNLGDTIFVTYALQDAGKEDDVAGPGNGFVDAFDLNGNLLTRLISDGALNSPWGLALAPAGFPGFGGDLLVGNFGDGTINAYNPSSGAFLGTLSDGSGSPLVIDGLWALRFGNGGSAGPTDRLYFTAGPGGESHGLFGALDPTPEPGAWLLSVSGLALFLFRKHLVNVPWNR